MVKDRHGVEVLIVTPIKTSLCWKNWVPILPSFSVFKFLLKSIYFWLCWVFVAVQALVVVSKVYSLALV